MLHFRCQKNRINPNNIHFSCNEMRQICQIIITKWAFVAALFVINSYFGRKNAHFSAFCNMLNANDFRNKGIFCHQQMPHFNIIWVAFIPQKCHFWHWELWQLSVIITAEKMLNCYFRPKSLNFLKILEYIVTLFDSISWFFPRVILSRKFSGYFAVSRLLRFGRW